MALMRAREAVMCEFSPELRKHDLSPQQWRVLRALEERSSMDATTISKHCALLMPSLSRILKNLEARGLVIRAPSAGDQRRTHIEISDSGRSLFKLIAPLQELRYESLTERFGYGKLELLYELLEELVEKVGKEEV
ncbi:MAG: homoprotocatechuate degradation operon regulator HpaR [Halieaceae bacterium]|nr:homoprotocatechuate degradation operon regulator HpaR [Halieaceae bacterium]|tara:strand:+ start:408 stop:815 length:408 start_codon:yes stop_codon:yes gene_type:complete